MTIAQDAYNAVTVGEEMTLPMHDATVGTDAPVFAPYDAFKVVIDEFERMEEAGLVEITYLWEKPVGDRRYIDMIRFRRLK